MMWDCLPNFQWCGRVVWCTGVILCSDGDCFNVIPWEQCEAIRQREGRFSGVEDTVYDMMMGYRTVKDYVVAKFDLHFVM